MAEDEIADVTKRLEGTKVGETFELSFKGKGLKLDTKDDAKVIVEGIEGCRVMTALRMEGNTLGVEAAEVVAGALQKHPEFQRAYWSDMFTGRLKSEIPAAMQHLGAAMMAANARLVELDLSDNAFGPNGLVGVTDLLKSPTCYTLQTLKLHNCGLGPTGGKMLAKCLMECYELSSVAGTPLALKTFISGRGRLESEGSKALAEVFKYMGSLEEVRMIQNGITSEGISALAAAFQLNTNLRILDLSDNTFSEEGAVAMAKALPKLQKLEVINFEDCLVRTRGAKAIANSLSEGHKLLRELVLSGNEICTSGAVAIAEAVENKQQLQTLSLDCNEIGEEGIELVRETMETIGKQDVLASFSGDEGTGDEDEGEDDDQTLEDEDVQEEVEGEVVNDPALTVQGTALTPKQNVNVRDLLAFPSPTKLRGFSRNLASSVKHELGSDIYDVEKVISTMIRICSVVTENDEDTKHIACKCADELLKEVCQSSDDNMASLIANAYLVYLGLLKGEDKKYRPPSDITGPLLVLEHVVKQSYFPRHAKTVMLAFIDRPHPLLQKSMTVQGQVLAALYATA